MLKIVDRQEVQRPLARIVQLWPQFCDLGKSLPLVELSLWMEALSRYSRPRLVAALGISALIIIETGGQKALYATATAIVGCQPKVALAPIPKF